MTGPIHTITKGRGKQTLLLMGLGAGAGAWSPHQDAWSQSRLCIAVDNRGTPDSPYQGSELTTGSMALETAALLDSLGGHASDIVGISMGACIAQELALLRPDLVRSLVLVSPWATVEPYVDSVLSTLSSLRGSANARLFNETLRNLIWTPEWVNHHDDEMTAALDSQPAMDADAFAAQTAACRTHDTMTRLRSIVAPTLVTYGDADRFIPPMASLAVARTIPHAETASFPGLGHVHHWEALDRFNDLVERWLG